MWSGSHLVPCTTWFWNAGAMEYSGYLTQVGWVFWKSVKSQGFILMENQQMGAPFTSTVPMYTQILIWGLKSLTYADLSYWSTTACAWRHRSRVQVNTKMTLATTCSKYGLRSWDMIPGNADIYMNWTRAFLFKYM